MPCYGCQLKQFPRTFPIPLSNTNNVACHGKILTRSFIFTLLSLALAQTASPQLSRTSDLPAPPPSPDSATVERPDFAVKIPRINPPAPGDYDITADGQESEGGVYHLHGHVVVELFNATFKADDAEFDENTKIFKAHGNVYYRNYDHNEVIYCDTAEYNTDTRRGTFHHVRGFSKTKVQARPGILTTQEPFYFEGEYAEKLEDKYVLHNGIITDCHIPHPWWTLHSRVFDIIPDDRAVTRNATFHLRRVPMFYFPWFYKGLKKEPRKSGFLSPEIGNSSQYGYMVGLGYYWAISRSLDVTYIVQDFTQRGFAHHADFRGKPTQKSDFDLILYGVNDRGDVNGVKAPGVSIIGTAKAQLPDGWMARANIDYLSSLRFRQTFTNTFNEAIFSATNSTAFATKSFSYYAFNADVSRTENFQDALPGNSTVIRRLPEFDFNGRDRQISSGALPAWFSFDTSFGLYHRVQPNYFGSATPGFYETSQFSPRLDFEPSIATAFHWGSLGILPSFTMHETYYGQRFANGAVSTSTLTRSAPELNIDFALPPLARIFDRKTFMGDKLKHVIEPRLRYKYVTGVDNFLSTLRFDQIDLLADTNELEIGITNHLYAKRGGTVTEILTWELFQKRFFDPTFGGALVAGGRNVAGPSLDLTGFSFLNGPRNYSPIVSVLRASPRSGLAVQWEADYDPLLHRFVNSILLADVRFKRYFVSAGSNQVRPDPLISPPANQFRTTFGYGDPNRKGWNSAFSTIYDFRLKLPAYVIAQVTYNTDCCGISFEFRSFDLAGVRHDNQYRVAFSIANIGTFGNLKKQERLF
jgi:LPS-assembly protein